MKKLNLIYEGKAKKVFSTINTNQVIVSYKDDATAFNGQKKGIINKKGLINNKLTNHFMQILENFKIPTHFIKELSPTDTLVKKVKIVPLEVIVRNKAAGSFAKRFGVKIGTKLIKPSVEFSLKNDNLNDPLINFYHIIALNIANESTIQTIINLAFKINEILIKHLLNFNVELIDFKLEFGETLNNELILADEISPDTCRFWDLKTHDNLDKDRFRQNLNNPEKGYEEMFNRLLKLENEKK